MGYPESVRLLLFRAKEIVFPQFWSHYVGSIIQEVSQTVFTRVLGR